MTTPSQQSGLSQNRTQSQQAILSRILEAIERGDQGDEFNEYMRQARFIPLALRSLYEDCDEVFGFKMQESCDSISLCAKRFLSVFEKYARRTHGPSITRTVAQYRAWKWLLRHKDADTFMYGECPVTGRFQLNPIDIYKRLLDQIVTGQWDKMTNERTTNNHDEVIPISEQQQCTRGIKSECEQSSKVSRLPLERIDTRYDAHTRSIEAQAT